MSNASSMEDKNDNSSDTGGSSHTAGSQAGWALILFDASGALGVGLTAGSINTLLIRLIEQHCPVGQLQLLWGIILFGILLAVFSRIFVRRIKKGATGFPRAPDDGDHANWPFGYRIG